MKTIIKRAAIVALPLAVGFALSGETSQPEVRLMTPASKTIDTAPALPPTSTAEPTVALPAPAAVPVVVSVPAVDPGPPTTKPARVEAGKTTAPVVAVIEPEPVVEEPAQAEPEPEPLPDCPPVTYDGTLPQDGGTGPVWETPDGQPPAYDCNGPGYTELPSE